jgi:hypothetical protein
VTAPLERFKAALHAAGCRQGSNGSGLWTCPGHDDSTPSLSIGSGEDGRVLVKCHTGCATDQVVAKLGLRMADLFPPRDGRGEGGVPPPPKSRATHQRSGPGLTLAAYATAKRLPVGFLQGLGLREVSYFGPTAVLIPYRDAEGREGPIRYRLVLEKGPEGDDRFHWKKGSKPTLYGLWRLEKNRAGHVVLVEGESDCHTLWFHEIPALGIPGADMWRDEWAQLLEAVETVYAIDEGDRGGETLRSRLTASPLRDRLRFVTLAPHKDPSALHVADPDGFRATFQAALDAAVPAVEIQAAEQKAAADEAWALCADLARATRILEILVPKLRDLGAVGEERAAKLLFLALVSRLLRRPVSVVLKGPSSAGKSYTTEQVLRFFPEGAYYSLSGMSERFLVYDPEPLAHRMIVISEAAGIVGDFATYLVRTLLSEGRLVYGTVDRDDKGNVKGRKIEKPGPTGVILTTTAVKLHGENETRLFSIPVDDTPMQTKRVLASLADGLGREADLGEWHALQRWLEGGERRVMIPFARRLAELVPPVAVRLRRDFGALLQLVSAHALLHRANREVTEQGIVANLWDYAEVRALVVDIIGEAAQRSVSPAVRETVEAVADLIGKGAESASVTALAARLQLDKSAASRRYQAAREGGYLVNREPKRGRPAQIVLGDPLPEEVDLLPTVEALTCCSDFQGGTEGPLPPHEAAAHA